MARQRAQSIGRNGEEKAAAFLRNNGISILARNFHADNGEVDIIARDGNTLVFIEVKSAVSTSFGDPLAWVDDDKSERIANAADMYIQEHNLDDMDCRFDIITVDFSRDKIEHIKNAFWCE